MAYAGAGGPRPASATQLVGTYPGAYGPDQAFRTPSGKLGCEVRGSDVWCRDLNLTYQGTDVGDYLMVGFHEGKVAKGAATDAPMFTMPGTPVLEYGQVRYAGSTVFASSTDGLTVWDTNTGRGVFMNKAQATTF